VLVVDESSREKAARAVGASRGLFMSELKLRPPKRQSEFGYEPGADRKSGSGGIEERSFVAKGAPLDDGQKRFGW